MKKYFIKACLDIILVINEQTSNFLHSIAYIAYRYELPVNHGL